MMMPSRKNSPWIKIINNALIELRSPSYISILWNFGSLSNLLNNPNSHSDFSCYTLLSWLIMLLMEYHTSAVILITVD